MMSRGRHILLSLFLLSGCGTCAAPLVGAGGATSSTGGAGQTDADGGPAGASSSGSTSSSSGAASSSGASGSSGALPTCPPYQAFCSGTCIPVVDDPDHCGDCTTVCTAQQACSGGRCVDAAACLPGYTACDRACVDLQSDNAHCGSCGDPCGANEGCVDGSCVPAIAVGPAPAVCASGGPPIQVQQPGSADLCSGNLAQTTFTWALCSCRDVGLSQELVADAFDSLAGPYTPGGVGGSVGVNQQLGTSARVEVGGSLWVAGSNGVGTSSPMVVKQVLRSGGPVGSSSSITVGRDAYVDGDVQANPMTVGGVLRVPAGETVGANVTATGGILREPVNVPLPCRCDPQDVLDVAGVVDARRTDNDNATIGLDADALTGLNAPARLDLPCGRYFLSAISTSRPVTIVAHGHVALHVGTSIQTSGNVTITLDSASTLDLFIGAGIGTSGTLSIGNPAYPALTRVYVGGDQNIGLSSALRVGANVYAPRADVGWSGGAEIYGSLFARNLGSSAPVRIHYDTRILAASGECPGGGTPVPTDGGVADASVPMADAGAGGPACNSCGDCLNQACNNGVCGACTSDNDCCAPLLCLDGVCDLLGG